MDKAKKVATVLQKAICSLKQACTSPYILSVPEPVLAPVRNYVKAFEQLLAVARNLAKGRRTVWLSALDRIPVKEAKAAEHNLRDYLLRFRRASS